ncbi:portal protein, partial [Streptomyces coelicoflavus ZG0656]
GYSVGECMFEIRDGKAWLSQVKARTPWRFRFSQAGELRLLTRADMINGVAMPPQKFWTTSWGADNDDEPYGLGLAHQLYWPVFFKKQGLGFWLRALERFGAPTGKGTFPAGTPKAEQDKLLRAIHRMRMDGSIVVPEGVTVELLEAVRGTVDQAAFNRAMNAEISKIVLGQTMTTDDGASLSQSEVHMEVREELTDADAEELCESFMAGPAAWLTAWNFPGAKTPIVKRTAAEDKAKAAKLLAQQAEAVTAMKAAGYEPTP